MLLLLLLLLTIISGHRIEISEFFLLLTTRSPFDSRFACSLALINGGFNFKFNILRSHRLFLTLLIRYHGNLIIQLVHFIIVIRYVKQRDDLVLDAVGDVVCVACARRQVVG